jgi:ABC-type Fe3+-siderophore transport system permease subunit
MLRVSVGTLSNAGGETLTEEESKVLVYKAIWNMAASLSLIIFSMTLQALADKPLDPPGTLLVNSRYLRLSSRIVYIIVILLVPIKADISVSLFMGIAGVGLSMIIWWEWIVSLEQPARLLEPKGLTTLMKQEGILGRGS